MKRDLLIALNNMVRLGRQLLLKMYILKSQKGMGLLSIMKRDTLKLLTKKVIARRLMVTTSLLIRNKPESTKDGCLKDLVVAEVAKPEKLTKKKRI
jgi:hypothetical protein